MSEVEPQMPPLPRLKRPLTVSEIAEISWLLYPALESLRVAESALALKASLRAPEQARVNRVLDKVREALALYREVGL